MSTWLLVPSDAMHAYHNQGAGCSKGVSSQYINYYTTLLTQGIGQVNTWNDSMLGRRAREVSEGDTIPAITAVVS